MSNARGSAAYDCCVIGGGIVGLSVARELLRREPGVKLVVLEKESRPAVHQTGHNSGVIHAGVYYRPGSLKARLCREGALATKAFCRHNRIPFLECGKLLVATNPLELERMEALSKRATENGIGYERLDRVGLQLAEPAITGLGALLVPSTGIVSYSAICEALAVEIRERGGEIAFAAKVLRIDEHATGVDIRTSVLSLCAARLVVCGGLQSDRLALLAGLKIDHRIIPFRGEYYTLPASKASIVRHLIYPIPDPELPFLGVHLTRTIDGSVTVGPNAVLGFAREGYPKGSLNGRDLIEMAGFVGFWRTLMANWRSGVDEFHGSLSKRHYLEKCRKYCPSLTRSDLIAPDAGIRAQAVLRDGTLVHDFLFVESERMLHVCNAPSPAATSAIPIAAMIVERLKAGTLGSHA